MKTNLREDYATRSRKGWKFTLKCLISAVDSQPEPQNDSFWVCSSNVRRVRRTCKLGLPFVARQQGFIIHVHLIRQSRSSLALLLLLLLLLLLRRGRLLLLRVHVFVILFFII